MGQTPFWRHGAVINDWAQKYAMANPEDLNFSTHLDRYNGEILFAYSEYNQHYGEEHASLVSSAFTKVQLEQVNNCGHEIIHFGWNHFYPVVIEFLDKIL